MNNFENSLRIDLLEKGQKLNQFTDMVENQYHLDDYQVVGASPNFYTKKVYIYKEFQIFYKDFIVLMKIIYRYVYYLIQYGY